MTIREMFERAHSTALAKCWYGPDGKEKRVVSELLCLFHSEVSEALEAYRDPSHELGDTWYGPDGKPEGIPSELADILIRIGDTCVHMDWVLPERLLDTQISELNVRNVDMIIRSRHIPTELVQMHNYLSEILRKWAAHDQKGIIEFTGSLIIYVGAVCQMYGWDLDKAVIGKLTYNDLRPARHGGKRA